MVRNVVQYLKHSAEMQPDKVAFVDEKRKITFAELDTEARKLAAVIMERCHREIRKPIAVYMEKGVECVIAFMGIAYSGNFYSPVDVKSPAARSRKILDTLEPMAIIYNGKEPDMFYGNWETISMEDGNGFQGSMKASDMEGQYGRLIDTDPLYVLFTSGSTGMPKGVVISHKGVIDYMEWLYGKFGFDETAVFGNQAPFYFDNSILDIYSTIRNASTTVIIPEKLFLFPNMLIEYMNANQINTIFWVPSALVGLANSGILPKSRIAYLKKVLFCGEVMPNKQLNVWRKAYPDLLYANLYGPTEITDVCTYYIVDREFTDEEALPIGFPCENTDILVLNEKDEKAGVNEIGELCVRGTCLSMGYYGNEEKTKGVFVQNPTNGKYNDPIYRTGDLVKYNERGELVYLCRKDFQIKYQGHRIELGEIEAAAGAIDGILQCCAVYEEKEKKIVLFCTAEGEISEKGIYKALKTALPKYMLPAGIVILKEMPLNRNGKIDRVLLRDAYCGGRV